MTETMEWPEPTRKQGFWSGNHWVLALGAMVAVGGCLAGISTAAQSQAVAAQTAHISQLQQDAASRQAQIEQAAARNASQALGVSDSRVQKDTAEIQQLLSTAFTWNSGDTYESARSTLKSRFDLTEEDAFMQSFMPPAQYNQDQAGKRYYYLDAVGLNSVLGSNVDIEVVEVSATNYRYAVMADTVVGSNGPAAIDAQSNPMPKPTATRRVLILVTTDTTGKLTQMTGFPASGATRQSG
ncbi:hypothetical protein [Arthrobacter bambusae]|uniref:Lipoprotein n=1 Tax=Arthrobacter bambusae TaxID=1338426 RepID=A0AAW8DAD6_9MICC|nr:hypothetical protein [Arthrobacter bambusae]MDP9904778.1 hypothetical protein [Arthrobacter bambusae]MDQ0129594.1 hypothetical protein [Arthrobacter bambusae]MDQ0180793.1 hypothetical protein [Arthrobacter bambusae]